LKIGSGRGIIAAALLHDFDLCIGMEILQSLVDISIPVLQKYDQLVQKQQHQKYPYAASAKGEAIYPTTSSTSTSTSDPSSNCEKEKNVSLIASKSKTTWSDSIIVDQRDGSNNVAAEIDWKKQLTFKTNQGIDVSLYRPHKRFPKVQNLFQDFLQYNWTNNATHVLANSTCFDDDLMRRMSMQASKNKLGTMFFTLTKPLFGMEYRLLEAKTHQMSWGMATIFAMEKVREKKTPVIALDGDVSGDVSVAASSKSDASDVHVSTNRHDKTKKTDRNKPDGWEDYIEQPDEVLYQVTPN
jgi:hypothetical protein